MDLRPFVIWNFPFRRAKVMKNNSKYLLIKFAAIVFIIAALIYSFPHGRMERTTHTQPVLASTPRQVTMFDDSRPETRIERLFELDYPPRFDLATLLQQEQRQRGTTYEDFPSYPAIASAGRQGKGDMNQ
jgi:hypothetical protein